MDKLIIMPDPLLISAFSRDDARKAEGYIGEHYHNYKIGETRNYLNQMFEFTLSYGESWKDNEIIDLFDWFKSHTNAVEGMYIMASKDPKTFPPVIPDDKN